MKCVHDDDDQTVRYQFTKHAFARFTAIGGNMKFTTFKRVKHGASKPALRYTGDDPAKGFKTDYTSGRPDKTDDVWNWRFKQKR